MTPFFFKKNPFVEILIPFLLGISLEHFFELSFFWFVGAFFVLLLVAGLWLKHFSILWDRKFKILMRFIVFFVLGGVLYICQSSEKIFFGEGQKTYEVTINNPLIEGNKVLRGVGEIRKVYYHDSIIEQKVKVYLLILKDSQNLFFDKTKIYTIRFKKNPQHFIRSNNIGTFEFAEYQKNHHIEIFVLLGIGDIEYIDFEEQFFFKKAIFRIQDWVVEKIRKYVTDKKNYGFLEALLIGYKNDLEKSFYNTYIESGTVHIIAISGLHLGFIYWVMGSFLFVKLNKTQKQRWIRGILICVVLIFYTLIAGATPSVLRACIMFCLLALGNVLREHYSVLNILSFSGFAILLFDTYALFDIGFIFSYLSVLSLFFFEEIVRGFFIIKNRILVFLWGMLASILCAQILVFPMVIYMNHFFPTYFVINNFIAVPLSTLLLILVFLLLLFSGVSFISFWISKIMCVVIGFLNTTLLKSNDWVFSKIFLPHFNFIDVILYFGVVILLCIMYYKKEFHLRLFLGFVCCCVFLRIGFVFWVTKTQEYFIFYQHPKKEIIEIVKGRRSDIYVNEAITEEEKRTYLNPTHFKLGIFDSRYYFMKPIEVFWFRNKKIVYALAQDTLEKDLLTYDFLVINKKARIFKNIKEYCRINCNIVFDNSFFEESFFKAFLREHNECVYSLRHQGAWILKK